MSLHQPNHQGNFV